MVAVMCCSGILVSSLYLLDTWQRGGPHLVSFKIPVRVESRRDIFSSLIAIIARQHIYSSVSMTTTPTSQLEIYVFGSKSMCLNHCKQSNILKLVLILPPRWEPKRSSDPFRQFWSADTMIRWYKDHFQIGMAQRADFTPLLGSLSQL